MAPICARFQILVRNRNLSRDVLVLAVVGTTSRSQLQPHPPYFPAIVTTQCNHDYDRNLKYWMCVKTSVQLALCSLQCFCFNHDLYLVLRREMFWARLIVFLLLRIPGSFMDHSFLVPLMAMQVLTLFHVIAMPCFFGLMVTTMHALDWLLNCMVMLGA